MSTHRAAKYGEFFTLFGGIIALSCFFMPWMETGTPWMEMDARFTPSPKVWTIYVLFRQTSQGDP